MRVPVSMRVWQPFADGGTWTNRCQEKACNADARLRDLQRCAGRSFESVSGFVLYSRAVHAHADLVEVREQIGRVGIHAVGTGALELVLTVST
jgi:hypothetical protein